MKHFRSMDGLRAWFAWVIVIAHVGRLTGADTQSRTLAVVDLLSMYSVCLFRILSGFVIAHLILEKHEPYLPYLTRRALRVYPIYLICLGLGFGASYLHFAAFADRPWGDVVPQPELFAMMFATQHSGDLPWHLLAHLGLLQGAISNRVLPASEYLFLGPAWTLSLEWQFYLIAPFVLLGLRTARGQILLALATIVSYAAYRQGWFGAFFDPSFLPGSVMYFAVGIVTRLTFLRLPEPERFPLAAFLLACGFCLISHDLVPFVLWFGFVASLRCRKPVAALELALTSRIPVYLGVRTFTTYLVHEPIIFVVVYLCIKSAHLGMWETYAVTLLIAPILTHLASIPLHRYVEAPAIAYGRSLFRESSAAVPAGPAAAPEPRLAKGSTLAVPGTSR